MTDTTFLLDGCDIPFTDGQSILDAARAAGAYIPHLCWHPDFTAHGSCRLCTVKVAGRHLASCTTRASAGMVVENLTDELQNLRKSLLQMLFVEGNHFCPGCEKSGQCVLQATAYQVGMDTPHFEEFYPQRELDGSHPDLLLDRNRCIACGLCVRASAQVDQTHVFELAGHGLGTHVVVNSVDGTLKHANIDRHARSVQVCPVGALLPKRVGFAAPIGERRYDLAPIEAPGNQEMP
jgi:[NiFe] hydrogenase diaphorase moiety small subunit